ncbi:lachesin-like [Euwallacea similis]|uniref:lachesin-like n=1 Tax=Euwallacea similis TaxID=1736056 RepID=UPI00344E4D8E
MMKMSVIIPTKVLSFSTWMVIMLELSTVLSGGEAAHTVKRYAGLYTGPYFDSTAPTNITTQLGTHAYLPCKVKQLGNKSVSWIRKRDAHILTVDKFTFIADDRFQAFPVETADTWTLQVKYVQARDAGQYECQVSTEPKMSHFITLNVVIPKIEITGKPDMFVKMGSSVQLKCVITQSLEEPSYIFWYHDGERVLTYDKSAVDIRAEREGPDTTVSTLIIHYTNPEDSGNYTCSPSNLDSSSVLLHVLNGEHPAAMQRGKNSASPIPGWSHLSMGLGLAACTPPRFAIAVALSLAVISEVLAC